MRKMLKILICIMVMLMTVSEPVNIYDCVQLNAAGGEMIVSCLGSLTGHNAFNIWHELPDTESESEKKTVFATADETIHYASLKTVNPMDNPTSLDDFTLISVPGTVLSPKGELEYVRKVKIEATAYCSCSKCCGPYDGTRTADGSRPKEYYTIATSKFFSFGTMVYIPYFDSASNGGVFEVEDRGGAIQNNRIDVYFSTHEKALRFGRKNLEMYILR